MAEPPYDIIASNLTSGKVISSLSTDASFGRREPSDSKFYAFRQRLLSTKTALSAVLAEESSFPSDDVHERSNLAKVSSSNADMSSDRPTLWERLRVLLGPSTHTSAPKPAASNQVTLHQLLARATQSPSHPLENLRQPETRL